MFEEGDIKITSVLPSNSKCQLLQPSSYNPEAKFEFQLSSYNIELDGGGEDNQEKLPLDGGVLELTMTMVEMKVIRKEASKVKDPLQILDHWKRT